MRLVMVRDHRAFGRPIRTGEEINVADAEARTWIRAGWAKKVLDEPHEPEQERRGPGRPKKQVVEGAPAYSRRDLRAEDE